MFQHSEEMLVTSAISQIENILLFYFNDSKMLIFLDHMQSAMR